METGLIFGLWAIIQVGIGVQFWYDAKEVLTACENPTKSKEIG